MKIMEGNLQLMGQESPADDQIEHVSSEIRRITALIDTCIHLFPESPSDLEHQNELLTVLGIAQDLLHNLESRLLVVQISGSDVLCDPRDVKLQL
jgi:hypothetical protein